MDAIHDQIVLTPDRFDSSAVGLDHLLISNSCSCKALAALFGLPVSVNEFFNKICRILVGTLYDQNVPLPKAEAEWGAEVKRFVENYKFPCVGARDGFHVYVNSNQKNYFRFKKRYSMTNLGLVGLNKRFLYAPVGLTGSTHDARLLKESSIYTEILDGDIMPDKVIQFADLGEIPLFTIGGSAFPQYTWRFLYKKTECRHFNLRYIIVASAALHSI